MIALYDLETVSARGRQEAEVEVAGMKMLSLWGVTRTDRRRNEFIRVMVRVR